MCTPEGSTGEETSAGVKAERGQATAKEVGMRKWALSKGWGEKEETGGWQMMPKTTSFINVLRVVVRLLSKFSRGCAH